MARQYQLTWDKSRKRWKKIYKGHQLYFHFGKSKTDPEGYQQALDAFKQKKAAIDLDIAAASPHRGHYEEALSTRQQMLQWFRLEGNTDDPLYHQTQAEIEQLRADLAKLNPPPVQLHIDPLMALPVPQTMAWMDRLQSLADHQRWTGTGTRRETVGGNIDDYLTVKKLKAVGKETSAGRYETIRCHLDHFKNFLGERTSLATIRGKTLTSYHTHLMLQVNDKKMARSYAADLMGAAIRFVKWCWGEGILPDLPKNFDSPELTFKVTTKAVETFTVDEIKTFLGRASERTRLYLLLMLNTGATQKDISDLKKIEVDWEAGRITRKRSKTKTEDNVPEVSYLLWDETYRLLQKHRSQVSERVLVNAVGGPLKVEELRPNGRVRKIDNIKTAYDRLTEKLRLNKAKPPKVFRKSAATKLEEHEVYGRFSQYFLGHSPRSVAEKHYVKPSRELFDRAISWLGEQYGLETRRQSEGIDRASVTE
jgi:integrase